MCSSPKAPAPAPAPLPVVAPPPILTIESAEGRQSKTSTALASNRGRSSLRIDKTQAPTGSTGSGLNIPA